MKKILTVLIFSLTLSSQAMHHGDSPMSAEELVKKAYATFAAGDSEAWAKLHAADLKFTILGQLPHSGTFNGTEATIKNVFEVIPVYWPSFKLETINIDTIDSKSGKTVYVLNKLMGDNLNSFALHMFTIEDNKIATFTAFDDYDSMRQAMVE